MPVSVPGDVSCEPRKGNPVTAAPQNFLRRQKRAQTLTATRETAHHGAESLRGTGPIPKLRSMM